MKAIFVGLLVFACAVSGFAAETQLNETVTSGTVVMTALTLDNGTIMGSPNIWVLRVTWTSDSAGNAVATSPAIFGHALEVVTIPNDGATSPSANYDVAVNHRGKDILEGRGANRSASAIEWELPFIHDDDTSDSTPKTVYGQVQIHITNAGAANGGVLEIPFRR